MPCLALSSPEKVETSWKAGLLASGSVGRRAFPLSGLRIPRSLSGPPGDIPSEWCGQRPREGAGTSNSGNFRRPSPVTATGSRRNFTGFPQRAARPSFPAASRSNWPSPSTAWCEWANPARHHGTFQCLDWTGCNRLQLPSQAERRPVPRPLRAESADPRVYPTLPLCSSPGPLSRRAPRRTSRRSAARRPWPNPRDRWPAGRS